MIRRLVLVAALALVSAQAAAAHAVPLGTSPANGTVLARPPRAVVVNFDSPVRPGPENAAVRADGRSVLGGPARLSGSRTLVIPLRPRLPHGDYTVRWSAVSEDGHEQEGIVAFAVGLGSPKPVPVLTVHGFETWQRIVMRVLFFGGVLGAAGAAAFTLLVLGPLGLEDRLRRPQAHLLFAFFLSAFCGSDALAHTTGAAGTRFADAMVVAAAAAGAGSVCAALVPVFARLRHLARAAAAVLVVCATPGGHALDTSQPVILAPAADLIHVGAAAVWVGGTASLCLLFTRLPAAARPLVVARFASLAVPAVVLVAAAGCSRALTELSSASQLWSTGYGRALLAKSCLFAIAVALAWLNRTALARGDLRAVRLLAAELLVIAAIVVAIGAMTDLRPGVAARTPTAGAYSRPGSSPRPSAPASR